MIWVGLTGGIAGGKTTVANFLKQKGVAVVDADRIAHQALKVNQDRIITYFGREILGDDGQIDRRALGTRVFSNEKLKKYLEGIIHPYVQQKVAEKKRLLEAAGKKIAVYDVPLLFENNLKDQFDHVLLVYVPEEISKKRLIERNSLSEEEAQARINGQMNIEKKKELADSIINNEGDIDALREQVDAWLESIVE